jgi:hypothetical protein
VNRRFKLGSIYSKACRLLAAAKHTRTEPHREREMGSMALLRSSACFLFLLSSSLGAANGMYRRAGGEADEEGAGRGVADGARGGRRAWPGYLYTRAVGRCTPQ